MSGRGKSQRSLDLVKAARAILEEIQPATVRGVCYQLFVKGVIPSMEKNETSRVSVQLTWAREQGIIAWDWIVDETREAEYVPSWDDPAEFARSISSQYRRNHWAQQDRLVEVWSEKGTLRGVLAPVLHEFGITFRVMHGFTSATTAHEVADMIEREDREVVIFYLGDWDPSGLYMSEIDLPTRLAEYGALPAKFIRLALNYSDIESGTLPSFRAKEKRRDPRYRWFVEQFGSTCWEVDALSPDILRARVKQAIRDQICWPAWQRCQRAERAEAASVKQVLGQWAKAKRRISGQVTK